MNLSISVNGGKITLNQRQLEDVLNGMSHALSGSRKAAKFGDVGVSFGADKASAQGGNLHFAATNKTDTFTDC